MDDEPRKIDKDFYKRVNKFLHKTDFDLTPNNHNKSSITSKDLTTNDFNVRNWMALYDDQRDPKNDPRTIQRNWQLGLLLTFQLPINYRFNNN